MASMCTPHWSQFMFLFPRKEQEPPVHRQGVPVLQPPPIDLPSRVQYRFGTCVDRIKMMKTFKNRSQTKIPTAAAMISRI